MPELPVRAAGRRAIRLLARSPRVLHVLDLAAQEVAEISAARQAASPVRTLYQMRRPARIDRGGPEGALTTRALRPEDGPALVALNERAFAWHPEPEQFGAASVEAEIAAPGFDPSWVLVHEVGGRLAGYCWTKPTDDPAVGLIHLAAVDPEVAGRGVGRGLVVAALESLAGRGLSTVVIYVDAGNTPAVRLYVSLGFVVNRLERDYRGAEVTVPARARGPKP